MPKFKFDRGQRVRVVRADSPFWWWTGEVTQQCDLGGSQMYYRVRVESMGPTGDDRVVIVPQLYLLFREDYLAYAD